MPGTKISFFDYYESMPRCSICNEIGYSPLVKCKKYQRKEISHKQEQQIYHS